MLLVYLNPGAWDALTEEQQNAVFEGHDTFQKLVSETGEMVVTDALADPRRSAVVQVRDGVVYTTEGPYLPAREFFCGYYVVECASRDRAIDLAALIPDSHYSAIEVRPFVDLDEDED
ncbi:YciI family protein [Longispora sp. K20-0274]|uniref:YciI family protein n=1 Tax=Longispora sp. K20-0274 TaxID=3088255 RepID=UPI0039995F6C